MEIEMFGISGTIADSVISSEPGTITDSDSVSLDPACPDELEFPPCVGLVGLGPEVTGLELVGS
jgi:hypothetical protein